MAKAAQTLDSAEWSMDNLGVVRLARHQMQPLVLCLQEGLLARFRLLELQHFLHKQLEEM